MQLTVIDVADATVAAAQVAFAVAVTTAPAAKPVPVMVMALVALDSTGVGETAVIVGPASMTKPAGATASAFATPPSGLVTE